jgi:sarcosine oxidase subunit beta
MSRTADVVVIGGGVVGSAAAYFLAQEGFRPLVVERGAPGAGTSGSSGGAVALLTKTPGLKLELAMESMKWLSHFADLFELDFEYRIHGSIMAALTEQEFEMLGVKAVKLRKSGARIELFDGDAAREYLPSLSPAVVGSAVSPADASVNPLLLVRSYLNEACRLGAEVLSFSEVQSIDIRAGRVTGVQTLQGPISTPKVVNAAGVWAKALARLAGVDLPIVPRKGEIVVTEPTKPILRGELFSASYLTSKDGPVVKLEDWLDERVPGGELQLGVAASQTQRGTLLIGSTREFAGYDTRSTYRGMSALIREMRSLVPKTSELQVVRSYAGLRPATMDGNPIIEAHPELEGLYIAAGHEGDGIALSPVSGALIADLLCGREHPFLPDLRAARFATSRHAF